MHEPKDLLTDIEQEILFEPASAGSRFLNYIIDIIAFYIVVFVFAILGGGSLISEEGLETYLVVMMLFIGYYTIFETATNGKTLGKLMTGTRAVKTDGSRLTLSDALLRSVCRMVPFEPLSAFGGNPWHDKWSNTKVVKR